MVAAGLVPKADAGAAEPDAKAETGVLGLEPNADWPNAPPDAELVLCPEAAAPNAELGPVGFAANADCPNALPPLVAAEVEEEGGGAV